MLNPILRKAQTFTSMVSVSDAGTEELASKLNRLESINIYGKEHPISDRSLIDLSLNCDFLKDVTIHCCKKATVTETGLGHLLRNLPKLERFSIGYVKAINSPSLQSSPESITIENSIRYAKALTSLKFYCMNISDNLLREIAKAKIQLRELWLISCTEFTVAGLLMVLSNNLGSLRIGNAGLVDADVELLLNGDVRNLTHFQVSGCQVTNSTLSRLATNCPFLVNITINSTAIGGQVNDDIPSSTNYRVKYFYLASCSQINDASLQQLTIMFPNLCLIDLSYVIHVTSTGIEAILKRCKFVRTLLLKGYRGTKIFEADSAGLAEFNLEELTLSDSCINGEGLAAIAKKCAKLVALDLTDCKAVGAEDIKQVVQNIKSLRKLHVCNSKFKLCEYDDLLEWMLSTGNLASLKKLYLRNMWKPRDYKKLRDKFLDHGCLLLKGSI